MIGTADHRTVALSIWFHAYFHPAVCVDAPMTATKRSEWNRAVIEAAVDKVAEALAALEVYVGVNGYDRRRQDIIRRRLDARALRQGIRHEKALP